MSSRASNLAGFTTSISPPDNLSVGIVTATSVQTGSINNGPLAGFRNAIINGNFDHWQRGTSQTAAGYGSADRWAMQRTGSTCTMSRQAFALGQTDVPGEPTYFCRMIVTSVAGASNRVLLGQDIEGVRAFAGQQITVSFWAKADATKNIAINHFQAFGTGGSPSAAVSQLGVNKTSLTTSWQRITHTFTVPSISGKTVGSNNNDRLGFEIFLDAGSNFNANTDSLGQQSGTFDIAQVQIEAGPVATPFERRPIGTELELCRRYYQVGKYQCLQPISGIDIAAEEVFQLSPNMRATPTVSLTNVFRSGFNAESTNDITSRHFGVRALSNVASNPGGEFVGTFTASAEL